MDRGRNKRDGQLECRSEKRRRDGLKSAVMGWID
jgi:hypothetical protein